MNKELLTIILAAGKSKRFAEAGFAFPKPLLPMPDGKTLLEWQITRAHSQDLLFVGRKADQSHLMNKVLNTIRHPKSPETIRHRWIEDTQGPLDSLWQVRSSLESDREVLILYCDIVPGEFLTQKLIDFAHALRLQSAIVSFESDDPRFTKVPGLEPLACSGVFYFKNGYDLLKTMKGHPRGPEYGIPAVVYKFARWSALISDVGDIIDLGTPRDYFYWMAEQGAPVDETWKIRKTTSKS